MDLLIWVYLVFEKLAMKEASTAISRQSKQTFRVFNCTHYSHFNLNILYVLMKREGLYRVKNYLQFQALYIFVQEIYQHA